MRPWPALGFHAALSALASLGAPRSCVACSLALLSWTPPWGEALREGPMPLSWGLQLAGRSRADGQGRVRRPGPAGRLPAAAPSALRSSLPAAQLRGVCLQRAGPRDLSPGAQPTVGAVWGEAAGWTVCSCCVPVVCFLKCIGGSLCSLHPLDGPTVQSPRGGPVSREEQVESALEFGSYFFFAPSLCAVISSSLVLCSCCFLSEPGPCPGLSQPSMC